MATSVFPAASTAAGPSAFAVTITTANIAQKVTQAVSTGVYSITVSPTSSTATVHFLTGDTYIGATTTSSGSISYNLATAADKVYIQSSVASDVVTVNLVASAPVNPALSGTLDTITTLGASTYTQTGTLWVLAIGAGGGGGGGTDGVNYGGGGGSGALAMFYGNVTSSTTVTIGAAGAGGAYNANGATGGTTSFGAYAIATGGAFGLSGTNGGTGGVGGTVTAGTVGVAGSKGGNPFQDGIAVANVYQTIKTGTYGSGAGGRSDTQMVGGGSGIGTGGNGGINGNVTGKNATGYGSGGGGGAATLAATGGNGSQGVVYVLRGF
jgi:hypothetical protein